MQRLEGLEAQGDLVGRSVANLDNKVGWQTEGSI